MLDVLLAHSYFLRYDQKQVEKMRPYPPLATLYAASYLRSVGYSVALFDAMLATGEHEFEAALATYTPRFVVLYEDNFNFLSKMCLTRMREAACTMSQAAHRRGATVIASGSDVTDHPEIYLQHGTQYVILGEPEHTLRELLDALRAGQPARASLIPGLATADKEALEQAVFDQLDQSALVVPIGGLGTYPAMIGETSSIDWLTEVTAHEWTHHWLSFQPLGVRYLASPEMRIINETVASLVDREIGPAVMARYYADQLEPVAAQPAETPKQAAPLFDFAAEMGATRIEVDRLLDAGEVEAAEAYMEARRQVFVNHGYAIRKLNQAYFAFYGGYAAEPGGAAGADPIGPMLRELRAASPSLRDFMRDVARVTSYDDLVTLHQRVVGGS